MRWVLLALLSATLAHGQLVQGDYCELRWDEYPRPVQLQRRRFQHADERQRPYHDAARYRRKMFHPYLQG